MNGSGGSSSSGGGGVNSGSIAGNGVIMPVNLSERDTVVFPRIVTLIRNGVKPRRIFRLLLNKRNSPSYEHVLTAITQRVNLDTGCVRKVFALDDDTGIPVLSLADFFQHDVDVFFAYGNERVGADDFELDLEETRQINQLHKTLKTGRLLGGQKPKMPGKSHNETFECCVDENFLMIGLQGNDSLPAEIRSRYTIGRVIGDGNFAVVLRVTEKATNKDFALKIIDKSKCLGKEHYIDAEIRIMKQLDHPHIISLISDQDTTRHMYLVMELVNGGDLFDAITRVTRFSEDQSRIMIKHLAAAMAYLHNLGVVHRDIKPENLLVSGVGVEIWRLFFSGEVQIKLNFVFFIFPGRIGRTWQRDDAEVGRLWTGLRGGRAAVGCVRYSDVRGSRDSHGDGLWVEGAFILVFCLSVAGGGDCVDVC